MTMRSTAAATTVPAGSISRFLLPPSGGHRHGPCFLKEFNGTRGLNLFVCVLFCASMDGQKVHVVTDPQDRLFRRDSLAPIRYRLLSQCWKFDNSFEEVESSDD